mmetsp:Transcript_741/g.870  ORF Transcript_741/g.870 Transcript_741/m.870 type:complete len:1995 (-) Transcript_741:61-6045(-)
MFTEDDDAIVNINAAGDDGDPIGAHITALLNAGALSSKADKSSLSNEQSDPNSTFYPLLSVENINRLRRLILSITDGLYCFVKRNNHSINNNQSKSKKYHDYDEDDNKDTTIHDSQQNVLKTTSSSSTSALKSILGFMILSSFILSSCTHIILSFTLSYYLFTIIFTLTILIDFKDVYRLSPTILQKIINTVFKYTQEFSTKYLFAKRYKGRDQWEKMKKGVSNHNNYQHLMDRKIPSILIQHRKNTPANTNHKQTPTADSITPTMTTAPATTESTAAWKCENINWGGLYTSLTNKSTSNSDHNEETYNDNRNDKESMKKKKSLEPSSIDHIVATNFCFVMVHGKKNTKSKPKAIITHTKLELKDSNNNTNSNNNDKGSSNIGNSNPRKNTTNNYHYHQDLIMDQRRYNNHPDAMNMNNTNHNYVLPLSPIYSTKSEDLCETMNHTRSLESLQSIDAIELIRPPSHQKTKLTKFKKLNSSPALACRKYEHGLELQPSMDVDPKLVSTTSPHQEKTLRFALEPDEHEKTTIKRINSDSDLFYDSFNGGSGINASEVSLRTNTNSYDDTDISLSSTSYNDGDKKKDRNLSKDKVKWLDVGAKIGMRLLESEKVQKAISLGKITTTISSSFSNEEEHDIQQKENSFELTQIESPKNIAKPFHAMWTSPSVDNPGFDDGYESYYSESEEQQPCDLNNTSNLLSVSNPPRLSRRASTTHSISPPRRQRRTSSTYSPPSSPPRSMPCSPLRSRSLGLARKESTSAFSVEFDTNISLSSSEAFQLVPKQFDANRYLPASMAIHPETLSNDSKHSVKALNKDDILAAAKIKFNPYAEFAKKKLQKECAATRSKGRRRAALLPGVRIIVPIFPPCCTKKDKISQNHCYYQFATVKSSKRIKAASSTPSEEEQHDCLSVKVFLDKSFMRNSTFAEMTIRIMDSQRQMPRHSKFPIGACVATSFGIGVLIGWRAEDDIHIVRALWQKRGQGAAHAYLNRNSLHGVMETAVGFRVGTTFGYGKVIGYTMGGKTFQNGKYIVLVKKNGSRTNRFQMELNRSDIKDCHASKFIPVVEQIREAAKYRIQVDTYEAAKMQLLLQDEALLINQTWRIFSQGFELFLSSFIKAAEEDDNIDSEINNFLASAITFLEDFDLGGKLSSPIKPVPTGIGNRTVSLSSMLNVEGPGMWIVDGLLGDTKLPEASTNSAANKTARCNDEQFGKESYKKVYAFLRTTTRTVAIAKSCCSDKPNLKMALAIIHEILIFIHNVIKVQQVNMSQTSIDAWRKTLEEFSVVFGPMNSRLQSVGNGILQRLQEHGKIAKVRAFRFVDTLISDELLMKYLEDGDIAKCMQQVESAVINANIIDAESCAYYHQIGLTLFNTITLCHERNQEAAVRNGKKITLVAKVLKVLATPGRSALKLLTNDEVLEIFERVFVRVFEKENDASQAINIYSWNFRSFRHLRLLNNMAIAGNLWAPVLDAADEEFSWAVSRTPSTTRCYVAPFSKLFSLGVSRFHQLHKSDVNISVDWLDFLKEEEAVKIIQDLDSLLMLSVRNLCNDMREMMQVLPYYSSLDEDILRLIDEVDIENELKEAGKALVDVEKFPQYIREKSATAVSKFLDFLPKMSIPIERREISEGWVVTCRGRNGKDLTLSNVKIDKENLLCKVFGGENVIPVFEECKVDENKPSFSSVIKESHLSTDKDGNVEVSILDHVAELIRNAQSHGCWQVGGGNFVRSDSPYIAASSLKDLPLSEVLICAIDLWENLEIDDDELLEIAIRDVSHQIQKKKSLVEDELIGISHDKNWPEECKKIQSRHKKCTERSSMSLDLDICNSFSKEYPIDRFDPKKDPTVLYLVMNQLTCALDDFTYRVEPSKRITMFDPVFEGVGTLSIKNASIKLKIDCRKERIKKFGGEVTVPVLQLQELDVGLEQVKFRFKETGADWLLNKIVSNFTKGITQLVRDNMMEQISLSINDVLEHLNSYIEVNPDIMLKILGISIDDLEENIAWV